MSIIFFVEYGKSMIVIDRVYCFIKSIQKKERSILQSIFRGRRSIIKR